MNDVVKDVEDAIYRAQQEIPEIPKNKIAKVKMKSGGEFSYRFADLSDIKRAIAPVMTKYKLKVSHLLDSGKLLTYITHLPSNSSHVSSSLTPEGLSPQEVGAWLTYFRRYHITIMLDLLVDEDVDGIPKQESVVEIAPLRPPPNIPTKLIQVNQNHGGDSVKLQQDPGSYVVTVGKNKGKTISDLDGMGELSGFMWWIENKTEKPLKGELKKILEAANQYVKGQHQPPKTDFSEDLPF